MKVTPVKGTNDYTPYEVSLRDYLQDKILETYKSCGFQRINTPILEELENLDNSEGGENLGLIFKILKRGDKLTKTLEAGRYDDLSDIGLRYDLTLPLSRYYANKKSILPSPFKCIQIDKVFRAERPQKGRLREFMQCDIDILGSDSINCEIELIDVTAKALMQIGLKDFTVRVNDRRILKEILAKMGFAEDDLESVGIIYDKLDKIGVQGVENELYEKGMSKRAVSNFIALLKDNQSLTLEQAKAYCNNDTDITNLQTIIKAVEQLSNGRYKIKYDQSLVRGQGYYTGVVFEIESNEFGSSIAGGGRYNNMIGKFTNDFVPAVGFSIGFERIVSILLEKGYEIPINKKKVCVLYEESDILNAIKKADELRDTYDVALAEKAKKIGKQFKKLQEQDIYGVFILGESEDIKIL